MRLLPAEMTPAQRKAEAAANCVSEAVNSHSNPSNPSLKCSVTGITHRGGFRLGFDGVEHLSGDWMDQMRCLCLSKGYRAAVEFDTVTGTATLSATPTLPTHSRVPFGMLAKIHPMTLLFIALLCINAMRHILADMSW